MVRNENRKDTDVYEPQGIVPNVAACGKKKLLILRQHTCGREMVTSELLRPISIHVVG